MRKTLFSLALAMAVLSSCSSDDIVNNPMNEENHSFPASRSLHENILSFSSEELNSQPGTFTESEFVKKTTGTGNVCERSAVAACRMGVRDCRILFKKEAGDGVTVAAAYDPRL